MIAAFASFSHRRIAAAPDVEGLVTATVIAQPWRQALQTVMAHVGLRVEFRADSSVYILRPGDVAAPPKESLGMLPLGRTVSGIVDDAETRAPIANAFINVAGLQLIGAPNMTWSDAAGRFSLRVPDGEVWLDASASGYEFSRVTLEPRDNVALFHGRSTRECSSSSDTTNMIASRRLIQELVYEPAFVIDGKVVRNGKFGSTACAQARPAIQRIQFKVF